MKRMEWNITCACVEYLAVEKVELFNKERKTRPAREHRIACSAVLVGENSEQKGLNLPDLTISALLNHKYIRRLRFVDNCSAWCCNEIKHLSDILSEFVCGLRSISKLNFRTYCGLVDEISIH